jgi:YidC/Oxa1 family membrane protein insertase
MFTTPPSASVDYLGKRLETPDELLGGLKDANANLFDITGARVHASYGRALDKSVAEQKLKAQDTEAKRIEAAILLADAQLKAGIARNDNGRIRTAQHTLLGLNTRYRDQAAWTTPIPVPDTTQDGRFGWKEWTGQQLYDRTVAEISERSKRELIWGAIPGGYAFIDAVVKMTGSRPDFSYAFAAFLLAVVVRIMVWPFAQRQLMHGRQMMQLVPLLKEVRDKFPDDPVAQQRKTMEIYTQYGVNPMAGCFPALVQIPLFLTVYQCMLLYQFEFTKGTFLWVNPATSRAAPPGLVAPNLGQLDPMLIVLYGIMMIVSTLLTPVSDPTQIRQQRLIGIGISIFFTVTMFFGWFPVPGAFVLYWIFLLILSSLQAMRAYRLPMPPLQKVASSAGGSIPGFGGKWAKRMEEMMQQAQAGNAEKASSNGKANPSPPVIVAAPAKTGAPAKHKPKKRK